MASGFVTNDGKDLDSRYLGINAKAASAKTADNVTNKGAAKRSATPIYFTISGTGAYTAASTGVISMARGFRCWFPNLSGNDDERSGQALFVNKGDVIRSTGSSGSTTYGVLVPVGIS